MLSISRLISAACLTAVLALLMGCNDAETAWRDVLNKCAATDVVSSSDRLTFMGVSNSSDIGTVYYKSSEGLNVEFDPAADFKDPKIVDTYVQRGVTASCVGAKSVTWTADPTLALSPVAPNLSDSLKAEISHSTKISVSVPEFRMDELKDFEYKKAYSQLDASYFQDLNQPDRYVSNLTIWVSGLSITMDFSTAVAGDVKAALSQGIGSNAGLSASWNSDTELQIKLTDKASIIAARLVGVKTISGIATDAVALAGQYADIQDVQPGSGKKGLKVQTVFVPVDLSDLRLVNQKQRFHVKPKS